MRWTSVLLIGAAGLGIVSGAGTAATLLVPSQYATIQAAVDAAAAFGDLIQVDAGVYDEAVVVDGKCVQIQGVGGSPSVTSFQWVRDNQYNGYYLSSLVGFTVNQTVRIENLQNCFAVSGCTVWGTFLASAYMPNRFFHVDGCQFHSAVTLRPQGFYSSATFDSCTFDGGDVAISAGMSRVSASTFHNCGVDIYGEGDCYVLGNSFDGGSGIRASGGSFNLTIQNNTVTGAAGGITIPMQDMDADVSNNTLSHCAGGISDLANGQFSIVNGNNLLECGGGIAVRPSNSQLSGNSVWRCASGIRVTGVYPTISQNTVAGCSATGLIVETSSLESVAANVVVDNAAGISVPADVNTSLIGCNDVWENPGGNWLGVEDQTGQNANISLDPLFCDLEHGDLHVDPASPVLHLAGCPRVGAWGKGDCWHGLDAIVDAPNDQGRAVYVTWFPIWYDQARSDTTIIAYSLWRRVDRGRARGSAGRSDGARGHELQGSRIPPGEWDSLLTVPVGNYDTIAETACDSTKVDGMCWSVFFVRAHTADPHLYFDSLPDSGYSVDNLAPSPPPNLHFETPTLLAWDRPPEEDVAYYRIYAGDSLFFPEMPQLGTTTDTSFDIGDTEYPYCHVTATDRSGNEGRPSTVPREPTGLPAMETAPRSLRLGPISPNPFTSRLDIAYELPVAGMVRLRVYDVAGRCVRTLVSGRQRPGTYRVRWAAQDDRGQPVPGSLYFISLVSNERTQTSRVVLLH